jgi:hypothetical protein
MSLDADLSLPPDSSNRKQVYHSLNSSRQEIGLLKLKAARNESVPIHCEPFHVSMDTNPIHPHECIYYVWGDPRPMNTIHVQGFATTVAAKAERVLQRLRE